MKTTYKLLLGLLVATCIASAEEPSAETKEKTPVQQQFGYLGISIGPFPIPLPTFIGGYRFQRGHNGLDLSLQFSPFIFVSPAKVSLLYLYYPNPNPQSQFYTGVGIAPTLIEDMFQNHLTLSPEFVIGKQFRSNKSKSHFFQIQVGFPLLFGARSIGFSPILPFIALQYGIGF